MWEIFLGSPLSSGANILFSRCLIAVEEVWLLARLDVTTSIRDRDTNLGPVARSTVWWPNKRPARVQLAKILPGLILVTYQLPPAYVAIVQLSKVASIPPRFKRQSFSAPISSFRPRRPLLFTSYRNSLLFTPLSALGCDFCGTVREIWRNPISDLAKSIPRLEIQRLVPGNVLRCRCRHLRCRQCRTLPLNLNLRKSAVRCRSI